MEHYSNYSIFGSNIDNEYLLKLQNNESNIKIDIHNRDHNFTINYVSSNEIISQYNTLGLKDITRIDENNYIHKSISNSHSNVIQGQYGNQNDINGIYFPSVANSLITETLSVTAYSKHYFDLSNYLGEDAVYIEYIATNTYNNRLTTAQKGRHIR